MLVKLTTRLNYCYPLMHTIHTDVDKQLNYYARNDEIFLLIEPRKNLIFHDNFVWKIVDDSWWHEIE